jgi:hypothetical protein
MLDQAPGIEAGAARRKRETENLDDGDVQKTTV